MPATDADREMVLRVFGEAKVASVAVPPPAATELPPLPLIGITWRKDAAQDAKSKEKEKETTPEVVDLSSASDTPPKQAPGKKPEEKSENKVEYTKTAAIPPGLMNAFSSILKKPLQHAAIRRALQHAGQGAGIGAGAGAAYGALSPAEGEGRMSSALRRGAMGSLMGAGIGGGRAVGQTLPAVAPSLAKGLSAGALKAAPTVGGVAGAGLGGALGSVIGQAPQAPAKAKPEQAKPEKTEKKKPEKPDARQAAAEKTAQSASTDAGVLPSAADMKPDKQAPQQKAVGKPSKLNETMLTRGLPKGAALMPAPGRPPGRPPVATASDNEPEPKAPGGDIPYLGATGGAVLGGLEKLLGGAGWEGGQKKLQEWGQSPTARNIAGGTTATLAAIMAALAARKALKGGEDDEGLYAEAGTKLDLVKAALIGQSVPALKNLDGHNEQYGVPTRDGITTTRRNDIFSGLDRWSRGQ